MVKFHAPSSNVYLRQPPFFWWIPVPKRAQNGAGVPLLRPPVPKLVTPCTKSPHFCSRDGRLGILVNKIPHFCSRDGRLGILVHKKAAVLFTRWSFWDSGAQKAPIFVHEMVVWVFWCTKCPCFCSRDGRLGILVNKIAAVLFTRRSFGYSGAQNAPIFVHEMVILGFWCTKSPRFCSRDGHFGILVHKKPPFLFTRWSFGYSGAQNAPVFVHEG